MPLVDLGCDSRGRRAAERPASDDSGACLEFAYLVHALIFRSHLFWFFVAGASIFAIDALRPASETIIVDESVAERIAGMWQGQMGRPPTTEELGNLLSSWLEEEMFYRKAVALELGTGDAIVRRRLVQKLTFIAEQQATSDPSNEELRAWFDAESERYRLPERISFEQLRLPDGVSAASLQQQIESGADWRSLAAPSMQNPAYALLSMREAAARFGDDFAETLFDIESVAAWTGPVESEFGRHLVRITERRESEIPALGAVRNRVLNDYTQSVKAMARQDYLQELQEEFKVEWRVSK